MANRSMANSEVRISKAISYATEALGYSELRPNQELAVKHFLCGHDVFVSLPTRSSKSLCYCLLPKAFDFLWQRIESTQSIVLVISPPSCPQISEAYVVRRGTSGCDDVKSCFRLPVLRSEARSEAAQKMQNTETDAITDNANFKCCKYHDVFYTKRAPPCILVGKFCSEIS